MHKLKKIVIIPVYNESENISELILSLEKICDICIINDYSTDNTLEILKQFNFIHIIENDCNLHISKSIQKGFKYAIKQEYDLIATMDAGNSHSPSDLENLFKNHNYDLILSRRVSKKNIPIFRDLISKIGNIIFNFLYLKKGSQFTFIFDSTSGLRIYSKKSVSNILENKIVSKSFGFHMESLYRANAYKNKIVQIPIDYNFTGSSFTLKSLLDALKTITFLIIKS